MLHENTGWLVNDTLTCIPGTRTFWHDLLDWIPSLRDMTGGRTDFTILPDKIETEANKSGPPNFIIRNATFFRPMNIRTKTVSLLQDCYDGATKKCQLDVANSSDTVVFNSGFTYSRYANEVKSKHAIIPLGVDFDFFTPLSKEHCRRQLGVHRPTMLFIGDSSTYPKGFDIMRQLIKLTTYDFILVMKDSYKSDNERVRVFNRIGHDQLRTIINACDALLCTSRIETQHLASIEAAACNIPIITSNIGVAYNFDDNGALGHKVSTDGDYLKAIQRILSNPNNYKPRDYFYSAGLDKISCKSKWKRLIEETLNG